MPIIPKKYSPVGRCIYCGAEHYAPDNLNAKLGDEHIIPLAFGGRLVLPEASCRDCEKIINGAETHCTRQMVRNTREHLGLRARRHKRSRAKLPVSIHHGTYIETKKVSIADHPAVLTMFTFDPPGLILDIPEPEGPFSAAGVGYVPLVSDLVGRAARLGGKVNLMQRGGFTAAIFGQMLAKVAHSYAVAELGVCGYLPLLNNLVLGLPTRHMAQLVGGGFLPEPKSSDPYEISITLTRRIDGRRFWLVRVRLFADLGAPPYYVVAGEPIS